MRKSSSSSLYTSLYLPTSPRISPYLPDLAHHARELLELLELELDLVLAAVYGGPLPLGRALGEG